MRSVLYSSDWCAAQPIPFCLSAAESFICDDGNRPPFTNKTLTPSRRMAISSKMNVSTNILILQNAFAVQIYETNHNFCANLRFIL